jgi:hypothetical protein
MATGFDRWRHENFRQEKARIYFWDFILWFGTVIFSIEQLNKRKTTRPKAQSIYQRMGGSPWGRIWKSWPDIVIVSQLPEATVRYEWMERLMPRDVMVDRPERVLVIGNV